MLKALGLTVRLSMVTLLLSFASCQDGNLFGKLHKAGESGDSASLLSDANQALRSKDYSKALSLYEAVLNGDPDNADALYGAAAAAMGVSGLNFGQLVSNILQQGSSAPSIHGIGDAIAQARVGASTYSSNPNSILAGIELDALDAQLDRAICRLQRIVSGASDGSIPSDDIDTLINFGFLSLVRAVVTSVRNGYFDVINDGGDYDILELTGDNMEAVCTGTAQQQANVVEIARDLAHAYALFNRAATTLGFADDQIIVRLRNDINDAAAEILSGGSHELDNDCIGLLNTANPAINSTTFTNSAGEDAFQPPSSGC